MDFLDFDFTIFIWIAVFLIGIFAKTGSRQRNNSGDVQSDSAPEMGEREAWEQDVFETLKKAVREIEEVVDQKGNDAQNSKTEPLQRRALEGVETPPPERHIIRQPVVAAPKTASVMAQQGGAMCAKKSKSHVEKHHAQVSDSAKQHHLEHRVQTSLQQSVEQSNPRVVDEDFDLRKAIIYSEILKPKFDDETL